LSIFVAIVPLKLYISGYSLDTFVIPKQFLYPKLS